MPSYTFQWEMPDGRWEDYPEGVQLVLAKGKRATFELNGVVYTADPATFRQTNNLSNQFRVIRTVNPQTTWTCDKCCYDNAEEDEKCNICDTKNKKKRRQDKGNTTLPSSQRPSPRQPAALTPDELQCGQAQLVYIYNVTTNPPSANPPSANPPSANPDELIQYVYSIDDHIPTEEPNTNLPSLSPSATCIVCNDPFSEANRSPNLGKRCGGPGLICVDCLKQHMCAEVSENNVMPGIKSPIPGFTGQMLPANIIALLDSTTLTSFLSLVSNALLSREKDWHTCAVCQQGALGVQECAHCNIAYPRQQIEPDLQQLIKEHQAMLCPGCGEFLLHTKGMCSLLKCPTCFLVSNVLTGESADSYSAMRDKARETDTMWSNEDLAYQQELEAKDPAAFQALLERNGVTFSATYTRGTNA